MEFDRFVYRGGLGRLPIGQNLKPPLINNYTPLHSPQGNLSPYLPLQRYGFFLYETKQKSILFVFQFEKDRNLV